MTQVLSVLVLLLLILLVQVHISLLKEIFSQTDLLDLGWLVSGGLVNLIASGNQENPHSLILSGVRASTGLVCACGCSCSARLVTPNAHRWRTACPGIRRIGGSSRDPGLHGSGSGLVGDPLLRWVAPLRPSVGLGLEACSVDGWTVLLLLQLFEEDIHLLAQLPLVVGEVGALGRKYIAPGLHDVRFKAWVDTVKPFLDNDVVS